MLKTRVYEVTLAAERTRSDLAIDKDTGIVEPRCSHRNRIILEVD